MQMRDGAVWGGYPGVTAPLLPPAPSPPSQPTPEGTLVTPAPPETATPHNGLDELAPNRAGKFMHLLANFGTFNFFLNFFLHKTASSVPRGGIGNGHFIYSCSGTLQSSVALFCAWACWEAHQQVLLCCCTQSILIFWYFDIPTFGQNFSEHQTPTSLLSRWNELPSIHHSYCLLSWEVSALRKYTFILILSLKDIHLLGWWVFRVFFTVLIACHLFKSTWNGWLELFRWEKMPFIFFLLWYYQT